VALAAAVAGAGGLGSFGAHHLPAADIGPLVAELRAATDRPFAVNLWVPLPGEDVRPSEAEVARHVARLRGYYDELGITGRLPGWPLSFPDFPSQVAALLEAAPPVLSFVMGVPPAHVLADARRRGIVTIGTATTVDEAIVLEEAGLDAVVASGSDAGGHRGAFLRSVTESLVGTFSLVPQVADAVSIPVIAAGGIADGRGIAAARTLGADGVQIGTGFLATHESGASPAHKRALPGARTTVLTRLFSGRHARGIPNRLVRELAGAEADVPAYPVQNALMRPLRAVAAERELTDYMSLWAGQAAAVTRPRAARDYVDFLVTDTARVLDAP
jgi:nitronate monooxygenase